MKKWLKILLVVVSIAVMAGITVLLYPYITSLAEEQNRIAFQNYIDSLGGWGILLLFLIQLLQVFIAIIPGEPIEIIAGVMYGTILGTILCLSGILVSTVIIYYTVRKLGKNAIEKMDKKGESLKYNFLLKADNVTYLIFILFLIPGTPKDILTYLCPFTKVKPVTFFLISTFARIPSIITSTYAGANISGGNFAKSLLVFALTGIAGILGIFFHNSFIKKRNG